MPIHKLKLTKTGEEFLLYGESLLENQSIAEIVEKDIKIEDNQLLPVFEQDHYQRDKKLFAEHIESFNDLKNAYFLIKTKELNKPKSIRDMVIEKYESLSEYFN